MSEPLTEADFAVHRKVIGERIGGERGMRGFCRVALREWPRYITALETERQENERLRERVTEWQTEAIDLQARLKAVRAAAGGET